MAGDTSSYGREGNRGNRITNWVVLKSGGIENSEKVSDLGLVAECEHGGSNLESSVQSVHDDTEGDEEGGHIDVDTCERGDHGGPAEEEHGGDEDVGEQAETEEGDVGGSTPSGERKEERTGDRCQREM